MGLGANREKFEHWGLERLSGGSGLYPLPPNDVADSVFIGFPVESPDRPVAIFQRNGKTVETVEFKVSIVPTHERTNYDGGCSPGAGL